MVQDRTAASLISAATYKTNIEHFNPPGVADFERRLTHRHLANPQTSHDRGRRKLSSYSDATLVGNENSFDFVDCLCSVIKKYVSISVSTEILENMSSTGNEVR